MAHISSLYLSLSSRILLLHFLRKFVSLAFVLYPQFLLLVFIHPLIVLCPLLFLILFASPLSSLLFLLITGPLIVRILSPPHLRLLLTFLFLLLILRFWRRCLFLWLQ